MKKILTTAFSTILNVLIIISTIILIVLMYSFFQIKITKKDYVNICGYTMFQVASGSMLNTIHVDDIVIVKIDNELNNLNENDIIVFKQDDNIITHRIIKIDGKNITTKGDANNTEDDPITNEVIIGKVTKIIPNITAVKKVITSPEIIILILLTVNLWGVGISLTGKNKKDTEEDILEKKDKEDV